MPKFPRLRLSLRTLAIVIVIIAIGIQLGLYYFSPTRRLSRSLRAEEAAYVRREAAIALGSGIPSWEIEQAISVLINALDDPSPRVRESAAAGLAGHEIRAEPAVPKLLDLLNDKDRGVRGSAVGALGFVTGPDAPGREVILAAITRSLDDKDVEVRLAAILALIRLRKVDDIARPLAAIMGGPEASYQNRVRLLIGRMDKQRNQIIPGLAAAASDSDKSTRQGALQLLIHYAPTNIVDSALRNAAKDGNPETRQWASEQRERLTPIR